MPITVQGQSAKKSRSRRTAACLALLLALVGADLSTRVAPTGPIRSLLRHISPDFQVEPGGEADVTNYYEGLINEGGRSAGGGFLITHWFITRRTVLAAEARLMHPGSGHPFRDPEYGPNRRVNTPVGPIRTNSLGMVDREYSVEKPAGTRRILLFGDSLGRALGVPQGKGIEPQLEEWLNDGTVNRTGRRVEILNLSTSGHRVIRSVHAAIRKAPRLSADVFVLEIGRRDLPPGWASDIVEFPRSSLVPPHAFIRDLIQRSGVGPDDSHEAAQAKFDSIFESGLRLVLEEFRRTAAEQRVETVILLLPTAEPSRVLNAKFDPVRSILKDMNFAVLDLVDAFREVPDPGRLAIERGDPHPNDEGHAMLYARAKEQLVKQPEILSILLGQPSPFVRQP